jgi:hypothetical protein
MGDRGDRGISAPDASSLPTAADAAVSTDQILPLVRHQFTNP